MSIDIDVADIGAAARSFCQAQNDLAGIWSNLLGLLDEVAGMAGDDDPADKFLARYDPAVRVAWRAFEASVLTLGGVSAGLTTSANNYIRADHHSNADKRGKNPPLLNQEPILTGDEVPEPASARGTNDSWLPGPLKRFWPNADTAKLRAAARAWDSTRGQIQGLGKRLSSTVDSLTDSNRSDCVVAMQDFWRRIYQPGDDHAVLSGLENICGGLAQACDGYAEKIDQAHSKIKDAAIGAGAAIFGTSLLGLLGTIFTAGVSDEVAGAADVAEAESILGPVVEEVITATETEVSVTIGDDIVPTVESAALETPDVTLAEAEMSEVQQALDEEMAESQGEASSGTDTAATPGAQAGSVDDLNPQQLANYKRYLAKIPSNAKQNVKIEILDDGGVRLSADSAARNIPGSFARYVKILDNEGTTIDYYKDTFDATGKLVHSKGKMPT